MPLYYSMWTPSCIDCFTESSSNHSTITLKLLAIVIAIYTYSYIYLHTLCINLWFWDIAYFYIFLFVLSEMFQNCMFLLKTNIISINHLFNLVAFFSKVWKQSCWELLNCPMTLLPVICDNLNRHHFFLSLLARIKYSSVNGQTKSKETAVSP